MQIIHDISLYILVDVGGRVKLDVLDEVSVVTIDNPSKRNALTGFVWVGY